LDEGILHQICTNYSEIITIEDGAIKGGFGSAVCEFASQFNYYSNIRVLGIPDTFIEQGSVLELQQFCKIDVESLVSILSTY
jgi:1-deoxy-D-xylulose-5-phosphate synthase